MKSKQPSHLRSIVAHVVLIILSFMCLFFFYILFVETKPGYVPDLPFSRQWKAHQHCIR